MRHADQSVCAPARSGQEREHPSQARSCHRPPFINITRAYGMRDPRAAKAEIHDLADNAASVSIKLMRLRGERADKGGWNGARNAGRCNPHIDFRQLPAFNSVFKDTRENLGMGAAEKGTLFGKVHIHWLGEQRK